MSEGLEIMTEEETKDVKSEPPAEPAPRKRGRPPKPKVDPAPAAPTENGKDVRPAPTETPPKESAPSEAPPQVARTPAPPIPRRTVTTKRSVPRHATGKGAAETDNTATIILVVVGGLLALGALYLARNANRETSNAPQGEVMDELTRAWKELEGQVVNVTDKLTMTLGQR
jgi:outer membrane biosynthesis protein TonB